MNPRGRTTLAALLACAAAVAQEQTHEIGELGATLRLDEHWERKVLNKDLGKDQFQVSRRTLFGASHAFVVVRELRGIWENAGDYRRLLDLLATVGTDAEVVIEDGADARHAYRAFDMEFQGMDLTYRSDLVIRPGVAYHVLAWATRGDRRFLGHRVDDLLEGLSSPGADAVELEPKPHVVRAGGVKLTVAAPPGLFARAAVEFPEERLRLVSADEQQVFSVFVVETYPQITAANDELETLRDWDETTREHARVPFELDGLSCLRLVTTGDSHCTHSIFVPAEPGTWLVCRFSAPGTPADARPARDALLASLQPARGADDELVPLPPLTESERPAPRTALGRLLADSVVRELEALSQATEVRALPDDAILVRTWQQASVVRGDAREVLPTTLDYQNQALALAGGRWLTSVDGTLHPIVDGGVSPVEVCAATRAVGLGDDLVVARWQASEPLGISSFSWIPQPRTLAVLLRTPDGEERPLGEVETKDVLAMTPARTRREALLAVVAPSDAFERHDRSAATLLRIRADEDGLEVLGTWAAVTGVAPAQDGWLVCGHLRDEPFGIWHLPDGGTPELLVSGTGLLPVVADATSVTFVSLGDYARSGRLHRLTFEQCRSRGRRCQPFAAADLEHVARELFGDGVPEVPSTREELDRLVARADELARARRSAPLPSDADEFDALLGSAFPWSPSPSARVRLLLAAKTLHLSLQVDGTEWVVPDGAQDALAWLTPQPWLPDSPFARPYNPMAIVTSQLDGDEGQTPLTYLTRPPRPAGRLLLGFDAGALERRARELRPDGLERALRLGHTARIAAVVADDPANAALREHVYAALGRNGHVDSVLRLAREQLQGRHPDGIDVVALAAVHARRKATGDAGRAAYGEILRVLERAADDPRAYLMLGRVCEEAFPEELDRARQCFRRVLDLEPYGRTAQEAQSALTRLNQ